MLWSYLTVALRTLHRHRRIAFINIFGLAAGLACALLIALFVREQLSYDRFHEHADRVYRVTYEEVNTPSMRHLATVSPPMGPALQAEYAEVDAFVRLRDAGGRRILAFGDRRFYEQRFFYADSAFFDLFSFPLQRGDPATALAAPNTIVLTPETAQKYFGNADPIGQVMTWDDGQALTVTGVLAPKPGPSHLDFDVLLSFTTFRVPRGYPVTLESWSWISFHTYVRLAPGTDPAALEARLPAFMRRHFDEERARDVRLRLQPVADIYLGEPKHSHIASGNPAYVYGLSGIAALILLLACFNFANLSTAYSMRRAREVGVRKVLGAQRVQLMRQFLGESVLTALLSAVFAFVLVEALQAVLRRTVGWGGSLGGGDYAIALPLLAGLAVLLGVAAGVYPAFVLARYRPAAVLKGRGPSHSVGAGLRTALMVLQFAIAITLIAGSLVVARQMHFIEGRALGFEEEGVLALHMPGEELLRAYPALRGALLQNPDVVSVTKGGNLFDGDHGSVPLFPAGADDRDPHAVNLFGVHYDFVETLGLRVVAGRAHSEAFPADSARGILLNETAARLLAATIPGWADPLGRPLRVSNIIEGEVIGVVADFHFASLHETIRPLVLYIPPTAMEHVFVRVRPGRVAGVLGSLEQSWAAVVPNVPFDYTFLDDHVARLYEDDRRFARLVTAFSLLTILIACLGLYGLVTFVTQLRTKEIGIRKVLGASVPGLVALLSAPFLRYVALANVVAWPTAYVAGQQWLQGFAYRAELSWWIFALAAALTLLLAFLTMSVQAVKTATADPVNALRYE